MLSQQSRTTYHNLLDAAVLQSDNDPAAAIVYLSSDSDPITISRADFQNMVRRYASFFHNKGIQSRDLLIIAHTQNLESIYAFWGAMVIGAIPSMFPTLTEKLDTAIYMRHMAELVRLSNVKAILTTPDFAEQLKSVVTCPVLDSESLSDEVITCPTEIDENSIAFLQHSSGTT